MSKLSQPTDAELAARYLTTPRTIRNWRAKGYPLLDPPELEKMLRQQRTPGKWCDRGGSKAEKRWQPPANPTYSRHRRESVIHHGDWGEFLFGAMLLRGRKCNPRQWDAEDTLPAPLGSAPTLTDEEWEALVNEDFGASMAAADAWWEERERARARGAFRKRLGE